MAASERRALLAKTIATVSPPPAAPPPFPSSPLMDLAYENYQPGFGLLLVIALCGLVCLAACALCRLRRRREESCSRGRCSECCHGLLCTSHRRLSRWWPPELTRTPRGLRRVAVTYRLRVPASRVRYVPEAQGGLPPGPHAPYGLRVPWQPRWGVLPLPLPLSLPLTPTPPLPVPVPASAPAPVPLTRWARERTGLSAVVSLNLARALILTLTLTLTEA